MFAYQYWPCSASRMREPWISWSGAGAGGHALQESTVNKKKQKQRLQSEKGEARGANVQNNKVGTASCWLLSTIARVHPPWEGTKYFTTQNKKYVCAPGRCCCSCFPIWIFSCFLFLRSEFDQIKEEETRHIFLPSFFVTSFMMVTENLKTKSEKWKTAPVQEVARHINSVGAREIGYRTPKQIVAQIDIVEIGVIGRR